MNPSQHRTKSNKSIILKKGRSVLNGNKKLSQSPTLSYNYIEAQEKLNKAFDILFDEMFKINRNETL
jgi:hypothetical protein